MSESQETSLSASAESSTPVGSEYAFELSPGKLRFRMSVVEIFYNISVAMDSLLTTFLQTMGVTPGTLGIINSFINAAGVLAPPAWGVAADKMGSSKRIFMLTLLLSSVVLFFIPIASSSSWNPVLLVTIICVIAAFFTGPANSMMESWLAMISSHSAGKISYGSIRLWASISYALTGLIISPFLKTVNVGIAFQLYGLFAIPAILLASTVPDLRVNSAKKTRLRDLPFKKLGSFWMISFFIFGILFTLPAAWSSQFFPYLVADFGGGASAIAMFMGIRAFSEVPMLFYSKKIIHRFGLIKPLFLVAILLMTAQGIYAFSGAMWHLYIAQILIGLGNGLLISCKNQYIYQLAPEGLGATALTAYSSVSTLVNIFFSLIGGFLLDALGTRSFYLTIDVLLLLAAGIFALSIPFGLKILKKEPPKAFAYRG